jgi:hypothetical protein
MKDKELNLEEIESFHTLVGPGEGSEHLVETSPVVYFEFVCLL